MDPDSLRLVETLRDRRRNAGLTRSRLAAASGVDAALIARFERREAVPTPGQARALRIALTGEDEPPLPSADDIASDNGDSTQAADLTGRSEPGSEQVTGQFERSTARPRVVPPVSARPAPSRGAGLVAPPPPTAPASDPPDLAIAARDPDFHVYSTSPTEFPTEEDRQLYALRRIRTALILAALAVVLWWALGALQEGMGDVIDLFRTPTTVVAPSLPAT